MFTAFTNETPDALAQRLEGLPMSESIYDQLVVTAAAHGDNPAWSFIDDGGARTWSDVLAEVDRTAAGLSAFGVEAGSHVAIMAWNREAFPLTWLALSKLRAVIVPINPTYTCGEVDRALHTSESTFMILEREFLTHFGRLERACIPSARLIVIDPARDMKHPGIAWDNMLAAGAGARIPDVERSRSTLLNLQNTSGTTGFSKFCMLTNDYWIVLGHSSTAIFGTPLSRYYLGSSFYYMVGQRILMNAMLSGGCVFVPRKPGAKRFMRDVRAYECDYCATFEMIYKQPATPEDADNSLKLVSIFAFASENHRHFEARFDVRAQEFYGMTEIGAGSYIPAGALDRMQGSGSCGVAAPFRALKVVNAGGEPLPDGEPGELWVRGRGMFLGYYDNPEANEESFHAGWFRTGDIALRDEEGFYYIVGRTKDMVRRSGENIAAREIESVLRTMDTVKEVAIVPVPDEYRGEEIKAYIQLAEGKTPNDVPPEAIFEHCATHLAPFKVPRYVEYADGFPMTDSQRVQKRVLVAAKPDLRVGAYDRQLREWRG